MASSAPAGRVAPAVLDPRRWQALALLCGLAWSAAALLAARVVQGAGAAIMTPSALSIRPGAD